MSRIAFYLSFLLPMQVCAQKQIHIFDAANPKIQYTGRIDFSKAERPRFWAPGVYITARFSGSFCDIFVNDEIPYLTAHNYITVVVDGKTERLKLKQAKDTIHVATDGREGPHSLLMCKDTESGVGYLDFLGIRCENLEDLPEKPALKMEFIGDSITSGASSDLVEIPCKTGQWYDQNNAYESFGAIAARSLNAQWLISSVSGIGLIHSCCGRSVYMPDVYSSVSLSNRPATHSGEWDFKQYQPDIVTICLGQNDGIQDSVKFCDAYLGFLNRLRGYYPKAELICMGSPMANKELSDMLKRYLPGIVSKFEMNGDRKAYTFFFSRAFNSGCGGHPDLAEHRLIASELTEFIKKKIKQ